MLSVPWQIPPSDEINLIFEYNSTSEKIYSSVFSELELLKNEVGAFKIENGVDQWRHAVTFADTKINMPLTLSQPINRAYYKLVEIIRTCIIQPVKNSFHMCEAPGGFVQAVLGEFQNTIKNLDCTSMIGYNHPCFSPIISRCGVNIHQFENNDITNPKIREMHVTELGKNRYELITADGAIDNDVSPETVELDNAQLLASEIALAIQLQKNDGSFVVKVFSLQYSITHELICILAYMYKNVQIVKPLTSRSVNDERYVICQGFDITKKVNMPIDQTKYLSKACTMKTSWLNEMSDISIQFANQQTSFLRKALLYNEKNKGNRGKGKGDGRGRSRGRGRQRQQPY